MSVKEYFESAARHAEELLRRGLTVEFFNRPRHPLYLNRASELATRALTRAMVREDGTMALSMGHGAIARTMLQHWQPEYQNDVPGRFRFLARLSK